MVGVNEQPVVLYTLALANRYLMTASTLCFHHLVASVLLSAQADNESFLHQGTAPRKHARE